MKLENAFQYIESLPRESIDKLYTDPWVCQGVFEALSPLAKQLAIRLVFLQEGMNVNAFKAQVLPGAQNGPDFSFALDQVVWIVIR